MTGIEKQKEEIAEVVSLRRYRKVLEGSENPAFDHDSRQSLRTEEAIALAELAAGELERIGETGISGIVRSSLAEIKGEE